MSFYLARLLFALSAVPFVLFELPGLQALLSHTHPTGYSRLGECVPQVILRALALALALALPLAIPTPTPTPSQP